MTVYCKNCGAPFEGVRCSVTVTERLAGLMAAYRVSMVPPKDAIVIPETAVPSLVTYESTPSVSAVSSPAALPFSAPLSLTPISTALILARPSSTPTALSTSPSSTPPTSAAPSPTTEPLSPTPVSTAPSSVRASSTPTAQSASPSSTPPTSAASSPIVATLSPTSVSTAPSSVRASSTSSSPSSSSALNFSASVIPSPIHTPFSPRFTSTQLHPAPTPAASVIPYPVHMTFSPRFTSTRLNPVTTPSASPSTRRGTFRHCNARFNGLTRKPIRIEAFIAHVDGYKKWSGMTDEEALMEFDLVLEEAAAVWWQGIQESEDTRILTWESALSGLRAKYSDPRHPQEEYKKFRAKQGDEESGSFITRFRDFFKFYIPYDVDEKIILNLVYNLLDHQIKRFVSRESVSTINELLLRAKRVEDGHFVPVYSCMYCTKIEDFVGDGEDTPTGTCCYRWAVDRRGNLLEMETHKMVPVVVPKPTYAVA